MPAQSMQIENLYLKLKLNYLYDYYLSGNILLYMI